MIVKNFYDLDNAIKTKQGWEIFFFVNWQKKRLLASYSQKDKKYYLIWENKSLKTNKSDFIDFVKIKMLELWFRSIDEKYQDVSILDFCKKCWDYSSLDKKKGYCKKCI